MYLLHAIAGNLLEALTLWLLGYRLQKRPGIGLVIIGVGRINAKLLIGLLGGVSGG